jgi:hypothetical protein
VSRGGYALGIALAALGFVAGTTVVGKLIPQHVPVVTPKHEHLEAHRDAYSVLFIGTSVMYRHVVPELFAEEMRALGHDDRAFNFGVAHMTLAEADLVLDRVLALHSTSLKTVVLDLSLYVDSGKANHFTTRHTWWHTPRETYLSVTNDLFGETPDAVAAGIDLRAFGQDFSKIGRASRLFRARWDPALPPEDEDEDDVEAEGYRSLEDVHTKSVAARARRFAREHDKYDKELAARAARPPKAPGLTGYQVRMLEAMARRIQAAGLRPLLYESANHNPRITVTGQLLTTLPKLSFNEPAAYPDLYRFEVRFDRTHLNTSGAQLLTKHLARAFARTVYPEAAPAPGGAKAP